MSIPAPGITSALERALSVPGGREPNGAVAALARAYAAEIDAAPDRARALEVLGPRLLAALVSLGMAAAPAASVITPGSPLTTQAQAGPPGATDLLAQMRARRGSA